MKLKPILLYSLFFVLLLTLRAEDAVTSDASSESEVENDDLPEATDPPYSVGDRATIQGYYIPLEDDISLNFRFVDNWIHIYWVDANDLIVKPQSKLGSVRFLGGNVRFLGPVSPIYISLLPMDGVDGLVTQGGPSLDTVLIPPGPYPPHIFNVILSLQKPDSEEFEVHNFRYVQALDETRETRAM